MNVKNNALLLSAAITAAIAATACGSAYAADFRTTKNPVEGRYIVVLKESAARLSTEPGANPRVPDIARQLAAMHRAKLLRSYEHALRGFVVDADDAALTKLLADPRVAYVEEDGYVTLSNTTQNGATWGLDRVDQRNLPLNGTYTYATTASNVHAYVIDSGVLGTHNEFAGRMGNGYTAIIDGNGTSDCTSNGHGTHVAGTIGGTMWGVAKGVTIHPVRVFGCTGGSASSTIIAGVDWVRGNHIKPAVANMSLGGGANSSIDTAVNNLINSGVTVVVAAGNGNGANACNYSPARVANALTIGSTGSNDARSSFSNVGACLDLFAPGGNITSAGNTSTSATAVLSGTSMASPHVAGAAALYLAANPSATPAQVTAAITSNATQNVVTSAGTGSPNRLLYTISNLALRPGLGGAWYNLNTSGQGFGIDIDSSIGYTFGGWYTYDVNGGAGGNGQLEQRWYTLQGNFVPGQTSQQLPVFINTGGKFDSPPTTQATPIGTATLSFQGCDTGRLDYQVNVDGQNRNGTVPLTRLGIDPYCASGTLPTLSLSQNGINPSLNGAWYDPNTSGQGFQFVFLPSNANTAFLFWYTYDVNGIPSSGPSGQRWYTIQGNYTTGSSQALNLPILQSTGGRFEVLPPNPTNVQVGTADLVFHSCTSASLTYRFNSGLTRTISLSKLVGGGANCAP
jgi:Subtilase family/Peptidase inhibitor I9